MKALIVEQTRRKASGCRDFRMPIRPGQDHKILDDLKNKT